MPHNLITKILYAKNRVQQKFQRVRHGRVAMQIERACGLQYAMHLNQAHRHIDQIGFVAIAANSADRIYQSRQRRIVTLDFCQLALIHIVQRPGVFERSARRL